MILYLYWYVLVTIKSFLFPFEKWHVLLLFVGCQGEVREALVREAPA